MTGFRVARAAPAAYFLAMTAPQQARESTPTLASAHDKILIVDFGSQVTQLIARRVREEGVYSEIVPFQKAEAAFLQMKPKAVILSGGPESVHEAGSPRAPQIIFDSGVPVLGICYGQMTMATSSAAMSRAAITANSAAPTSRSRPTAACSIPAGRPAAKHPVWMSHGDRITKMPPGFVVAGTSTNAPFAVIQDEKRGYYGLMFHPEVVHTPDGAKLIRNFVRKVAGLTGDWTMRAFREEAIEKIRAQVGTGQGDLRPLRRRRFGCCRRVDPRGDRRPAHLRVRRSRAIAAQRGRDRGRPVPASLQHPAGSR